MQNEALAFDVSNADYAAIMFQMSPENGGPVSYARTPVLSLLFDPVTGSPAGVVTCQGFFAEAVIEDPYGGVTRGGQFWPDLDTFLRSEVLQ